MSIDDKLVGDHDRISGMDDMVCATIGVISGGVKGGLAGGLIGFGLLYSDGDYSTTTQVVLTGISALVGFGAGVFGSSREYS